MQDAASARTASRACAATTGTKSTAAASAYSRLGSGAGSVRRPSFAALIQFDRCCGVKSCCRAICATTAPGATACATMRPFSSARQRRRRTMPLRTSARPRKRCVASLVSNIMTFTWPTQVPSYPATRASPMWAGDTAYEESFESPGPAQAPEPLPDAVPLPKLFRESPPSDVVNHEILQGFKKPPIVPPLVATARARCFEYPQNNRSVLFRHRGQHGRSSIPTIHESQKSDLGIPLPYSLAKSVHTA